MSLIRRYKVPGVNKTKIVFYKGNRLLVRQLVFDEMEFQLGQNITEKQSWKCAELEVAAFISDIKMLELSGKYVPDISGLEEQLTRMRSRQE